MPAHKLCCWLLSAYHITSVHQQPTCMLQVQLSFKANDIAPHFLLSRAQCLIVGSEKMVHIYAIKSFLMSQRWWNISRRETFLDVRGRAELHYTKQFISSLCYHVIVPLFSFPFVCFNHSERNTLHKKTDKKIPFLPIIIQSCSKHASDHSSNHQLRPAALSFLSVVEGRQQNTSLWIVLMLLTHLDPDFCEAHKNWTLHFTKQQHSCEFKLLVKLIWCYVRREWKINSLPTLGWFIMVMRLLTPKPQSAICGTISTSLFFRQFFWEKQTCRKVKLL